MAVWTKTIKEDRTMRNNTNTFKHLLAAAITIAALAAGHSTAWAQETTYSIKKTFFSGLNYSPEPVSSDDDNFYYAAGTVITLTPTDAHKIIVSVLSGTLNAVIASNRRSVTITMPAQNVTSGSVTQHEVYKVTLPEGISLSGSGSNANIYTLDGETYCRYYTSSTWYTIVAPFGYVLNSATYDGTAATTSSSGNIGFYIKRKDAVVTAKATDCFGIGDGADGTAEHPYIITTTAGLTLLAKYSRNQTNGKYFELGADIAYTPNGSETENNFDGIQEFGGTFDGKGHTISGIRIYQNGTYHGLFKKINGGTVKNIVLSDASINAPSTVGGIVGKMDSGTLQNCLVLSSVITETDNNNYKGAIAGDFSNQSGCSNNFYHNCTVNGKNYYVGAYNSDRAWACGGYTIALPDGVSAASGKSLTTVGGTTYHGSYENTVTLTYDNVPAGKAALFTVTRTDDASLVAETAGTFTMPNVDLSVSAELRDTYTLTLPDGVSADGNSVTVGSDTYYLGGTTVALSYPTLSEGYAAVYSVNGSTIAGNTFTITANTTVTVAPTDVWGIASGADGTSEATAYVITTAAGLDLLANKVEGTGGYSENDYDGKFFRLDNDITYNATTAWNAAASTEDNFKPIGNYYYFRGTFDGQDHTVSGIRVYRDGDNQGYDDSYLGLFGKVSGTVKNITVSDARITGYWYVGGIVGSNYGTVQNCHAAATVAVHAVREDACYHGGVVGYNSSGTVSGCTSAATLSVADGLAYCSEFGGVVGYSYDSAIENCLALGATVGSSYYVGAIVGYFVDGTLTNNYYNGCTVNGTPNATNVGCGYYSAYNDSGDITDDNGARCVYTVTAAAGITATGTATVSHGGTNYYLPNITITLGHGEAPAGYSDFIGYSVKDANDNDVTVTEDAGNYTFTMPAYDVTATATWTANASLALSVTSATIFGESKYVTTFYHGTLDYELPVGTKAYTASLDGARVVFRQVGDDGSVIPHGTAVIVVADAASITLTKLASTDVTAHAGNILQGSDTAVTVTAGKVDDKVPYVLNISSEVLGFYKFNGSTIPAGKAYYLKSE